MKQGSVLLFLLLVINFAPNANATNGFIVKLKAGVSPVAYEIQNNVRLEELAPNGLYLAYYLSAPQQRSSQEVLMSLQKQSDTAFVQSNHPVVLRKATPTNKSTPKQWNWTLSDSNFGIDATSAWDKYGHGGKTAISQDIVIAVVDGGFDTNHESLAANSWVNTMEIPNNKIDDDNNGCVDDVNGCDIESKTGKIQMDDHGTHVAGIIGASGNQVTGVNWNIKIMYVSAGNSLGDTATVMAAYGYILKQKQLWLSSNGQKGANVVAINSSFGIDGADCNTSEYTAWNDMFDELGKSGILSVAATANQDWNIDKVGDLPTSCKSSYLMTVTNTDSSGSISYAGYGKKTIQLAAPGEDILSTLPDNSYGTMSGTSMASPHVAGSIGYLYSVATSDFAKNTSKSPGDAALDVKNILLASVTARPNLKDKTVSGGILNLFGASQKMASHAPRCR